MLSITNQISKTFTIVEDNPEQWITQTRKGERVMFVMDHFHSLSLFLEKKDNNQNFFWKRIKAYDIPNELKTSTSISMIKKIVAEGHLNISQFMNGDEIIRIQFGGLKGGMLSTRDLVRHLRESEAHGQLANSLGETIHTAPVSRTLREQRLIVGTSTALSAIGGGAVGGLAAFGTISLIEAAVGIPLLATATVFAPVVVGSVILIGIPAGIAGYFISKKILTNRSRITMEIHKEVINVFNGSMEAINHYNDGKKTEAEVKAQECLEHWMREGSFIGEFSLYSCVFNERTFKKIEKAYRRDDREEIVNALKLFIIITLSLLPQDKMPIDSLIGILEHQSITDLALRNYAWVIKGKLYALRSNFDDAIRCFREIPPSSDLYEIAQKSVCHIQEVTSKIRAEFEPPIGLPDEDEE